MNENKKQLEEWAELDTDSMDFDELESKLDSELEEQMADLEGLEADREKIGNPDTIGHTVMNVVWEQFINQVGVVAGEDFIKENRGLTLDLSDDAHIVTIDNYGKNGVGNHNQIIKGEDFKRKNHGQELDLSNDAHIQTTENFSKGKIATHNHDIDYQQRYDDWQNNFQRNEDGSIKTRYDRINGEDVAVLRNNTDPTGENYNYNYKARDYIDSGRPSGSVSMHKDHTIAAAEIIRDPAANAHLSRDEHAEFANSEINLVDLDASANESKGDHKMQEWLDSERYGKKPAERFNIDEDELRERDRIAREEYSKRKEEGKHRSEESGKKSQKEEEARSIEAGKQSQKEEAMRIGGKALRSVLMGLLASLIKDIIRKLISWFRSGKRKLSTFIDSVKEAIKSFVSNMKEHLLNAGNTLVTTIATAIFGPVIGMIKKAWIFLKQGYKSVKDAIKFLKDPANKNKPFSLKMMEVGKIVIVGLTAAGSIVLSEVIEKGLMSIPGFAFEIPLLGSLASLVGMFLGALVSGLIGALALNLIDRLIAKKLKRINTQQQIEKKNEILATQSQLNQVTAKKVEKTRNETITSIKERHSEAADIMKESISKIMSNSEDIAAEPIEDAEVIDENENSTSENNDTLDSIFDDLKSLS